jgi:hypothetical protein
VFRTTIRADETTDVEAEVLRLRQGYEAAGLNQQLGEVLETQTRAILNQLVSSGRQLAAQGSQMNVKRELIGDDYAIEIDFGAGVRQSFWQRLLAKFSGT